MMIIGTTTYKTLQQRVTLPGFHTDFFCILPGSQPCYFARFSTPKKSKYVPHQQQMEYGAFFQARQKRQWWHENNIYAAFTITTSGYQYQYQYWLSFCLFPGKTKRQWRQENNIYEVFTTGGFQLFVRSVLFHCPYKTHYDMVITR